VARNSLGVLDHDVTREPVETDLKTLKELLERRKAPR
jgi:hypothetical protein